MAEHTRLPWHHSRKSVYVSDTNHTCIAQMIREQGVNEANAAFIVKAVNNHDMLVHALRDVTNASNDPYEVATKALARLNADVGELGSERYSRTT
jgi:hypothetical protein